MTDDEDLVGPCPCTVCGKPLVFENDGSIPGAEEWEVDADTGEKYCFACFVRRGSTNCLAGFRCPDCGNFETFRIEVSAVATVTDDGIEITGDTEWNDASFCHCPECERDGVVREFTAGRRP